MYIHKHPQIDKYICILITQPINTIKESNFISLSKFINKYFIHTVTEKVIQMKIGSSKSVCLLMSVTPLGRDEGEKQKLGWLKLLG